MALHRMQRAELRSYMITMACTCISYRVPNEYYIFDINRISPMTGGYDLYLISELGGGFKVCKLPPLRLAYVHPIQHSGELEPGEVSVSMELLNSPN